MRSINQGALLEHVLCQNPPRSVRPRLKNGDGEVGALSTLSVIPASPRAGMGRDPFQWVRGFSG